MVERWTLREVATIYERSPCWVRDRVKRMIQSGRYPLAVIPWGKSYKVDPEAFDRYLCEEVRIHAK